MNRLCCSLFLLTTAALCLCSCGEEAPAVAGGGRGDRGGGRGGFPGFGAPAQQVAAIPVEVAEVARGSISDYLETSGTLEAESEVDIVARTAGPVVELLTEEGRFVEQGQLLARIDDRELKLQLETAKVNLKEAELAYQRAETSLDAAIIPQESFDSAKARYDGLLAQMKERELQLTYTEIRAPFSGLIIERAVKNAQFVTNGTRLFRISDFTPLLCPIQLPEKELRQVHQGQRAVVGVEAYPDLEFTAKVLRINPVVDAGTGTFRVTLEVDGRDRLRPGMFGTVRLETAVHENALTMPKVALVLESVGDTVYVFDDGVARRRDVELGFEHGDTVEVSSGLEEGDQVIVVGQDSVSDGATVYLFDRGEPTPTAANRGPGSTGEGPAERQAVAEGGRPGPDAGGPQAGGPQRGGGPGGGRRDPRAIDWNDPAQLERMRGMMRQRGLSDKEIEERLKQMKERFSNGSSG